MTKKFTLGNVCHSITYGVTTAAVDTVKGPRLLRITDLKDEGVDWQKVPGCDISEGEELQYKLSDGDIVIARTGGTIGKSFLIKKPPAAVYASYLLRLNPNKSLISPEYLEIFLRSNAYWSQLNNAAQGAAQPNVNASTLSKLVLNIPKIETQRRIAARLKAQLAEVEKARQATTEQLCETDQLANAIIYESLNSNVTENFLGDVLEEVKSGIGKAWAKYPVLGATRDGLAPAKEPPGKQPERYKPAFPGTVFYNPMRILIGSIAFVDEDDEPGITSPDYVALKGRESFVDSRWFYFWLRSPLGKQCIHSLARGAVRERMLFNRLAEGKINLPGYGTQTIASKALAGLKPMHKALQHKLDEINLLPRKILAQAFGG